MNQVKTSQPKIKLGSCLENCRDLKSPYPWSDEDDFDEALTHEKLDHEAAFQAMEAQLPDGTFSLGRYSETIDSLITWTVVENYYLVADNDDTSRWGLVGIFWDDNQGHYIWQDVATIEGIKEPKSAAVQMLEAAFISWAFELDDPTHAKRWAFLEQLDSGWAS